MNCLGNIKLRESIMDTIGWSWCADGMFSVKSVWTNLEGRSADDKEGFESIWRGFVPLKIEVFVWQMLHGRVLVRQVLYRFGLNVDNILECPMCGDFEETIDHLFFEV